LIFLIFFLAGLFAIVITVMSRVVAVIVIVNIVVGHENEIVCVFRGVIDFHSFVIKGFVEGGYGS
jgi:hypothetical protein